MNISFYYQHSRTMYFLCKEKYNYSLFSSKCSQQKTTLVFLRSKNLARSCVWKCADCENYTPRQVVFEIVQIVKKCADRKYGLKMCEMRKWAQLKNVFENARNVKTVHNVKINCEAGWKYFFGVGGFAYYFHIFWLLKFLVLVSIYNVENQVENMRNIWIMVENIHFVEIVVENVHNVKKMAENMPNVKIYINNIHIKSAVGDMHNVEK